MAFGVSRQAFTLTDGNGVAAKTEVYIPAPATTVTVATLDTNLTTLGTQIAALTNAKVRAQALRLEEPQALGPGVLQVYPSATDKAVLVYGCANGQEVRIEIPAPQMTIFDSDGETVNAANASVSAFNTAITGGAYCANSGSLITTYLRGFRSLRTREKR